MLIKEVYSLTHVDLGYRTGFGGGRSKRFIKGKRDESLLTGYFYRVLTWDLANQRKGNLKSKRKLILELGNQERGTVWVVNSEVDHIKEKTNSDRCQEADCPVPGRYRCWGDRGLMTGGG